MNLKVYDMNKVCCIAKEKSNIVFKTKEEAIKQFREHYGKEIKLAREKKIHRLEMQLCMENEYINMCRSRKDYQGLRCREHIKNQREKELYRLRNKITQPALYVNRKRILKSMLIHQNNVELLHIAGIIYNKNNEYGLLEEKYFLRVFSFDSNESLMEISKRIPGTEDFGGNVFYFVQEENLFEILRELTAILRTCVINFIKKGIIDL